MGRYLDMAKAASGVAPAPPAVAPGLLSPPAVVAMEARPERLAEVRAAYRGAMARLSLLYPAGVDSAWAEIGNRPEAARTIDAAEKAADAEALAYQRGAATAPDAFLAALARWEDAWAGALATLATVQAADVCDDCGRADATVTVPTAAGRFCRRCLRDGERDIVGAKTP